MKTATKNRFMEQEIQTLLAGYFPNEKITKVIPLNGGTFNTLYRINGSGMLSRGVILKTGPCKDDIVPRHEKDILRTEVYAYKMLETQKIPVPKIHAYDFSRTLLPCDYFIMDRVSGSTWYEHLPVSDPDLKHALGKYTARMHSVTAGWFGALGEDEKGKFATWSEAFAYMIDMALRDSEDQGLYLPYARLRRAVSSRETMLDTLKKPALVNFDLWPGNVLIKKTERMAISGLIDFECSFLGEPLASFASAFLLYEDVETEKDFIAGYNQVSETPLAFTSEDREKMLLYELLMYINGYAETNRYGFWCRHLQRLGLQLVIFHCLHLLDRMEKKRNKEE